MGAQGLQHQVGLVAPRQYGFVNQLLWQQAGGELGLARGGVPLPRRCGVAQMKAAGMLQAGIEILEPWNGVSDQVANTAVISHGPFPVDRLVAERGFGNASDDRGFRAQQRRARSELAVGDMHHAEGVFHGDALRTFGLHVDFSPPQARQDQRIAAGDQV
ncbi:hypothetical protein D3C79_632160 [compost metagenome]